MAYPKINARVTSKREAERKIPLLSGECGVKTDRTVSLRLSGPWTLLDGLTIEVPADYLPSDLMVGDEFQIDFFHVRRPREAVDAVFRQG